MKLVFGVALFSGRIRAIDSRLKYGLELNIMRKIYGNYIDIKF